MQEKESSGLSNTARQALDKLAAIDDEVGVALHTHAGWQGTQQLGQ
jgi:hypothetical protein